MKFKKYFLFLVIAALAAIVAACGTDSDASSDEQSKDNGTQKENSEE